MESSHSKNKYSSIQWNRYSNVSSIIMSKSDDLRLFYKMIIFEPWNFFGGPFLHNFCGGWAVFDLDTSLPEKLKNLGWIHTSHNAFKAFPKWLWHSNPVFFKVASVVETVTVYNSKHPAKSCENLSSPFLSLSVLFLFKNCPTQFLSH